MADKSINELVAASGIGATDLFVLQQDNTAKKLPGQVLLNWLTAAADGHGGIQSWVPLKKEGLVTTYRATLADQTFFDIDVVDGRGIEDVKKIKTEGLVDTYQIIYNDGPPGTITVTNGAKGDPGENANLWIRYASQKPTADSHSFGEIPDAWIGIAPGHLSTAPTDWQAYTWYKWKGEKGDTGEPAKRLSVAYAYQVGDTGNIIPSGTWQTTIPNVPQGKFLWIRKTTTWNIGDPDVDYSISRMGLDGSGSVSSVANISPDENGNVPLTAEDVGALPNTGGDMNGAINMNGHKIKGLNAPTEDGEPATKGYTVSQITDRVIYGKGKNLLKNTASSLTKTGITFTVNEDGSVTLNDTATNDCYFTIASGVQLPSGNYILSGCPSDGATNSYILYAAPDTGSNSIDIGNGVAFSTDGTKKYGISIRVASGVTVEGLTFYPMIRLASETDDTYEPYYEGLVDIGMKLQTVEADVAALKTAIERGLAL